MEISPAALQAAWPGGHEVLQPRAMQVLVMLARANGEVIARDDLMAACWPSRAVGDDALNRIILLLRRLAARAGGRAFSIETIAKVGHRLQAFDSGPRTSPAAAEPLLAVLEFDNLSDDPNLAYFSDGLSEEILHAVLGSTRLRVAGRFSSFSLRGEQKTPANVAAVLGATLVLDGSVRTGGGQVRVIARLADCATSANLWSGRFERAIADVLLLQDEIAAAVAGALGSVASPPSAAGPVDPAAFDLYLRAREASGDRLFGNLGLLEQAVARAPGFAQAWSLMSHVRANMLNWVDRGAEFDSQRAAVIHAAEMALALDPTLGAPYLALAQIEPQCGAFGERRRLVELAVSRSPYEPRSLITAAAACDVVGRQRDVVEWLTRAYALDPRLSGFYFASALVTAGRSEEGWAVFERDLKLWPEVFLLNTTALKCASDAGDWRRYDAILERLPRPMAATGIVAAIGADAAKLRHWSADIGRQALARMRGAVERTGTVGLTWAGFLSARGFADEVWDILEAASFAHLFEPQGALPRTEVSLNILFGPAFAALRRDRRFVRLCARLGMAAYWRDTGEWPDFESEVAAAYDLRAEVAAALSGAPVAAA